MKNVIVTGGSNGIGLECSKLYAKKNNNVFILDIVSPKYESNLIHYYKCDVGNYTEVKNTIDEINEKFGKIDIIINCAGKQIISEFDEYDYEKWLSVMKANYFGVCNTIHSCLNYFNDNATILNITSVHAYVPRTQKYAYDSSKSAISMLTKELALYFSSKGITINSLSFGAVNTNMNDSWTLTQKEEARAKVPLKIIFEPQEIAKCVYKIIRDYSRYTTGSDFTIDGGRSLI